MYDISQNQCNKYNRCNKCSKCSIIINYENNPNKIFYSIFHIIIFAFAIYLSFKCNNNNFNIGAFVTAFFFPHIYIIYKFATSNNFCELNK